MGQQLGISYDKCYGLTLPQPTTTIWTQLVHVSGLGIFRLARSGFDVVKHPSVFWRLSTL